MRNESRSGLWLTVSEPLWSALAAVLEQLLKAISA